MNLVFQNADFLFENFQSLFAVKFERSYQNETPRSPSKSLLFLFESVAMQEKKQRSISKEVIPLENLIQQNEHLLKRKNRKLSIASGTLQYEDEYNPLHNYYDAQVKSQKVHKQFSQNAQPSIFLPQNSIEKPLVVKKNDQIQNKEVENEIHFEISLPQQLTGDNNNKFLPSLSETQSNAQLNEEHKQNSITGFVNQSNSKNCKNNPQINDLSFAHIIGQYPPKCRKIPKLDRVPSSCSNQPKQEVRSKSNKARYSSKNKQSIQKKEENKKFSPKQQDMDISQNNIILNDYLKEDGRILRSVSPNDITYNQIQKNQFQILRGFNNVPGAEYKILNSNSKQQYNINSSFSKENNLRLANCQQTCNLSQNKDRLRILGQNQIPLPHLRLTQIPKQKVKEQDIEIMQLY